jgi:effector-binding domain-containing protein
MSVLSNNPVTTQSYNAIAGKTTGRGILSPAVWLLYFSKQVQDYSPSMVYEWLAFKGIIQNVPSRVRLRPKSQVTVDEAAYYYDGGHLKMSNEVQVCDIVPGPLAVIKGHAKMSNLSAKIGALFNQVYTELANGLVKQNGQNVVVYWNVEGENLLNTPEGCPIDVGVQVAAPFENGGALTCSATPGGTVANVAHIGPYNEMYKSYEALMAWCGEHGRTLAGPCWEIYGDWEDDPAKLRTDVYCLLK